MYKSFSYRQNFLVTQSLLKLLRKCQFSEPNYYVADNNLK